MGVVPTHGTAGAIWLVNLATRRWSVLVEGGAFGAPTWDTGLLSYNPRAFIGAGGVISVPVPEHGPCVQTISLLHLLPRSPLVFRTTVTYAEIP